MKKTACFLVFGFCCLLAFGQSFRGLSWGCSKDDVIRMEGNDLYGRGSGEDWGPTDVEEVLVYERKFGVIDGVLFYCFIGDRLLEASWMLTKDLDYALYYALIRKYGKAGNDYKWALGEWELPDMLMGGGAIASHATFTSQELMRIRKQKHGKDTEPF